MKRYASTGEPLTLEARVLAGRVRVELVSAGVRIRDENGTLLTAVLADDAIADLFGHRPSDPGEFHLALVVFKGSREIRVVHRGRGLVLAVPEREAIFRLLRGTEAWRSRRKVDPRTVPLCGRLRGM